MIELSVGTKALPLPRFEDFVPATQNALALSLAMAVAAAPGSRINPLYLCGGAGLGKTHLAQAAVGAILEDHPNYAARCFTPETFIDFLAGHIRLKTRELERDCRGLHVFVMENIERLGESAEVQARLLWVCEHLRKARCQLIFTASMPPQQVPGLAPSLAEFFRSGKVGRIGALDKRARLVIAHSLAVRFRRKIPFSVAKAILGETGGDIRQIQSQILHLAA